MRLVSALYDDFRPFHRFPMFTDTATVRYPDELRKGDVLLIWGGEDIHPSIYKKQRSMMSYAPQVMSRRDAAELALMARAKDMDIPIIGVCRGAQMLCAFAGGYLIQHVNNHGIFGTHDVTTPDGTIYQTNSLHHQMMVPGETTHEILAEIPRDELRSDVYWDEDKQVDHHQEPEYVYFNDVKGFAIQWHPEMMSHKVPATQYIFDTMEARLG